MYFTITVLQTLTFDELRRFEAELQGKFESDTDTEDKVLVVFL